MSSIEYINAYASKNDSDLVEEEVDEDDEADSEEVSADIDSIRATLLNQDYIKLELEFRKVNLNFLIYLKYILALQ